MSGVSMRELRTHCGEVIDRVAAGDSVTFTRAGKLVAELRPVPRPPLSAYALLARWSRVPQVDPVRFRDDIDSLVPPDM